MTIEGTVKDSALSCTNTQDISAQARLSYAEYHSALDFWLGFARSVEKGCSTIRRREDEVKGAEGALGQKESVAQVTPNQGGQANQTASE
jgi:hypothetical protein